MLVSKKYGFNGMTDPGPRPNGLTERLTQGASGTPSIARNA